MNQPKEYENKFLSLLQEYPKYCVTKLGYLDAGDIKDELIRKVWEHATNKIVKDTSDYDASNIISQALIDTGIVEKEYFYTSNLIDITPESTVGKIQEMAFLRRVAYLNQGLLQAYSNGDVDKVALLIEQLKNERLSTDGGMKSAEQVDNEFSERINNGDIAIPWAIGGMDASTGGKEKETLIVVAARPGMGKTSFMLQAARNDSRNNRVGFFELEMGAVSMWARVACPSVGVNWKDVISGYVGNVKKQELIEASRKLASQYKDLLIDDTPGLTSSDIYQKVVQNNLDVVYIDHLSLMGDKNESEVRRLGDITMRLKNMSKQLKIPVILAVQLNRGVDSRANKVPVLSDLRDSGEIEQNADNVLMMYRASYYEPEASDTTEVWVRKFRNGEANVVVNLGFDKEKQWFESTKKTVVGTGFEMKLEREPMPDFTI